MVHRRLLTVMLLLFCGLVIASAVTPRPERRQDARSTGTATTATTPRAAGDNAVRADVPAGVSGVLPRDRTVSARPGQTVDLRVTSPEPATIEIPALAALQPAAPGSPAQFVVAFAAAGRYEVRNLDTGDTLGTVVVK